MTFGRIVLLLSLCCLFVSAADKYEPDDSFDTAKTINIGETQQRSIDPVGDKDYIMFNVATAGYCAIESWGAAAYDNYMYLYDSNKYLIASDDDSGSGAFAMITRQLSAGTYWIGLEDYGNNNAILSYFVRVWKETQVSLQCTKLSFKRYLSGKQYPRHKWKLGLRAANVNLESLRDVQLYVAIYNSNNYSSYSLPLPYGRFMEYGRRDMSLRCATMFDVLQVKLTKGHLTLYERMSDTSLGGVSAPDYVFCMTDYKHSPIANLTIHIEARRAGIRVLYGDCAVQVRAKYARTAITASARKNLP